MSAGEKLIKKICDRLKGKKLLVTDSNIVNQLNKMTKEDILSILKK